MTVNGNVILNGGTLQPNTSTGIPNIIVKGDWTNNGGTYTPGLETVTFNNTATNQNINGSAFSQAFNNLSIAKSSNTLLFGGSITGVTVNNALTMTTGNIDPGVGGILQLGTSTSAVGTLTYSAGNITGTFKRWFNSTGAKQFPLGISSASGTATANNNTVVNFSNLASGSLTGSFVNTNPGSTGLPLTEGSYGISTQFSEGYWSLVAGDGLSSSNYALDLTATGFNSQPFTANSRILKRADGGGNWILDGTHAAATTSPQVAKRAGLSGFSEFGIGAAEECPTSPTTAHAKPVSSYRLRGYNPDTGCTGCNGRYRCWLYDRISIFN